MKKIKISLLFLVLNVSIFSQTTFYDNNTKKFGIIDKTQKIIMSPKYDYMSQISEGCAVYKENGKYGLLDKTGKTILKPIFNNPCSLKYAKVCDGLIRVVDFEYLDSDSSSYNEKYGFYNINGILKIKCIYSLASDFQNGKALVYQNEKYNVININGDLLYSKWFDDENEIKEKFIWNSNDENLSLLSYNYRNQKFAFGGEDNKYDKVTKGYVDEKGGVILSTNINYGNVINYSKKLDRALVFENEKYAYLINQKGEIISKLNEKIPDLVWNDNLNFRFVNGLGQLSVVKRSFEGEEEKIDVTYYLIDINGNVIKKMNKGSSDIISECNYGNR